MAEYIERELLVATLVSMDYPWTDFGDAYEIVKNAPSADVVEVVRCEKCNQFRRYTKVNQNFGVCRRSKMEVSWHDFCSYGEREDKHV